MSSFRIADLHMLRRSTAMRRSQPRATHLVTGVDSGNSTSFFNTFANVALRLGPLNGVVANWRRQRCARLVVWSLTIIS
jgi:hypothetical protein